MQGLSYNGLVLSSRKFFVTKINHHSLLVYVSHFVDTVTANNHEKYGKQNLATQLNIPS